MALKPLAPAEGIPEAERGRWYALFGHEARAAAPASACVLSLEEHGTAYGHGAEQAAAPAADRGDQSRPRARSGR